MHSLVLAGNVASVRNSSLRVAVPSLPRRNGGEGTSTQTWRKLNRVPWCYSLARKCIMTFYWLTLFANSFSNSDWLELEIYFFQTNEQDGEQNVFMVNFSDNSDLRRGFKACLRDFWERHISRRTNWLWKINSISSSVSDWSSLFSRRNRSLYLLCRPFKLSQKTRCTILMQLG